MADPWRSTWGSGGFMRRIIQEHCLLVALLLLPIRWTSKLQLHPPISRCDASHKPICLVVVDGQQLSWIWDWKTEEDEKEGATVDAEKKMMSLLMITMGPKER